MAGPAVPEPKPDLGWKATVAALVFVVTILTGFGAATAVSFDDTSHSDDSHAEDSHDDDHAEDSHAEDSHDE